MLTTGSIGRGHRDLLFFGEVEKVMRDGMQDAVSGRCECDAGGQSAGRVRGERVWDARGAGFQSLASNNSAELLGSLLFKPLSREREA